MPGWLFWLLWMAASLFGLSRGVYRFRKYGSVRPEQTKRLSPQAVTLTSQIEISVWALATCGGLVFGLIKILI